jgi:hypothetical protein
MKDLNNQKQPFDISQSYSLDRCVVGLNARNLPRVCLIAPPDETLLKRRHWDYRFLEEIAMRIS